MARLSQCRLLSLILLQETHGSVSVRHHGSISFAGSLPLPILAHHSQMSTRRTCSTSTRRASSVATLHRYGAGAATVPQSRTGAARAAAILLLSYCDYATAASDAGSELGTTDKQCCHVVCVVFLFRGKCLRCWQHRFFSFGVVLLGGCGYTRCASVILTRLSSVVTHDLL